MFCYISAITKRQIKGFKTSPHIAKLSLFFPLTAKDLCPFASENINNLQYPIFLESVSLRTVVRNLPKSFKTFCDALKGRSLQER